MEKLQTVDSCIITMYAEFIACFEATGQVIWLKKLVPDLKVVDCIHKPLKMYCDNQPAVFYAHNNKSSNAAKTIEIRYYVVKDKIQDQTISLEHIRTKHMLADPLTKGLLICLRRIYFSKHFCPCFGL